VIYLPLPWLTGRLGRPVVAAVAAPIGRPDPYDPLPPGAVVLRVASPPARLLVNVPADEDREFDAPAWEAWVDAFLRASLGQDLGEDPPALLGPDREALTSELLRLWSWKSEHAGLDCPEPKSRADGQPRCTHYPHLPSAALHEVLRFLATQLRRAPHLLLEESTFEELVFDYRILEPATPTGAGLTDADLAALNAP
jgi:hypothetical protein